MQKESDYAKDKAILIERTFLNLEIFLLLKAVPVEFRKLS